MRSLPGLLAVLALTAGCVSATGGGGAGSRVAPDADHARILPGPDGICLGHEITPAVLETVTEQVRLGPAAEDPDAPAAFRTVTRTDIVSPRRVTEFEAVCPDDLNPHLVASLQRALTARGAFSGPATGEWDSGTAQAVAAWQASNGGPSSPVLAVATARDFGLIALSGQTFGG